MNTTIKEVTAKELLERFGGSENDVKATAKKLKATAMVLMENLQMDSSMFGTKVILMLGPSLTYKTIADIEGQRLGDVPSRFQYPTMWAKVDA